MKSLSMLQKLMIFSVLGALILFADSLYFSMQENQDAAVVQSVHVALQKTIAQASQQQKMDPTLLQADNVINAIKQQLPSSLKLKSTGFSSSPYEGVFLNSSRQVAFMVTPQGDVRIKSLGGQWTHFHVEDGVIHKN